jgi:hypothetical protein
MTTKSSFALVSFLLSNAAGQTLGTFTAAGQMITPRIFHTATLLFNGKVLISGGKARLGGPYLAGAELYDPDTGTFEATGSMTAPRHQPTATLLPNGQVLIVGWGGTDFGPHTTGAEAEIYDPATGAFTAVANFPSDVAGANMNCNAGTLLGNGKVLVNVGAVWPSPRALGVTAQLYDPTSGTFAATKDYSDVPQTNLFPCPLATLLPDGKVLTTWNESGAELYDPDTASFSLTQGRVNDYYGVYTATLLTTGKVLITTETDAELYDPKSETFAVTDAPPLYNAATPLSDGTVLLSGGCHTYTCDSLNAAAELYDPISATYSPTGGMTTPRSMHTATLLRDGTVLIAGGIASIYDDVPIATAEIYTPAVTTPAPKLFAVAGDGRQGAIWHASSGEIASPESPAVAGEALSMYTTSLSDGGLIPPQAAIGGRLAEILYFGAAPGYPGYNQVNFRMPGGVAPAAEVPVRLTYLGRPSNEVTIGVK